MQPYKNSGNLSWISAFETGEDYVKVQFVDGVIRLYTSNSVGNKHIEKMKELAVTGKGLYQYIDKYVKDMYIRDPNNSSITKSNP